MAACAAVVCSLYFWTASTSTAGSNYYGLLADAFLDGRTDIGVQPRPELLRLDDPYDPVQNEPYRLHDASLYDGRYYLYFGPTPVALVHVPLRLVGVDADDGLAAPLLASAGYLFALALMWFLIERYRPRTGLPTRVGAAIALGLANGVPFLLRRPAVYETAIAGGYACLAASLHLTLTGALRPRPCLWRLAGGSLAMGLAVGARPQLILAAPVLLWAWWRALGAVRAGGGGRAGTTRLAVAALAPVAVCLALLALYNAVRFGSLTEFGSSYQLAKLNPQELDRFDLTRVVPGLFFYLLAPPHLDLAFPFAHLIPEYPGHLSAAYAAGMEPVAGALATTALLALAVAAPVLLLAEGRRRREPTTLAALLALAAFLILLVPVLSFDGATMRYEVDWLTLGLLAALLVWLRVQDAVEGRAIARAAASAVAVVAVAAAAFFGLAFSVTGYGDGLLAAHPGIYHRLESAFGWVPEIGARLRGEPVVLQSRPAFTPTAETVVTLAAPGAGTVALRAFFDWNPVLQAGSRVRVRVQGSGGVSRTYPLVRREMTIRAGLSGGGLREVRVRWQLVRAVVAPGEPPPELAGYAISGIRVAAWNAR
jgi:hypothetical protein